jgi:XTP/dITP diphosphohydrolase
MKLLIATHNPAKIEELSKYLTPLCNDGVQLVSLADVGITDEPEETGTTLKDNACLKACFYGDKSGLPALADDGGFSIDHLNGEPGVKSNRWLGFKATDQQLIDHTLMKLEGVPRPQRGASLVLCLCYYNPAHNNVATAETRISGYVAERPTKKFKAGFPYRALHIVQPFQKYYDELTEAEHDMVNHRRAAVMELLPKIRTDLGIGRDASPAS